MWFPRRVEMATVPPWWQCLGNKEINTDQYMQSDNEIYPRGECILPALSFPTSGEFIESI